MESSPSESSSKSEVRECGMGEAIYSRGEGEEGHGIMLIRNKLDFFRSTGHYGRRVARYGHKNLY